VLRPFVVVSGLPGSGKTTLARQLAGRLRLPLLDKDDVLTALLETVDAADPDQRHQLSRASDRVLRAITERTAGAVLASFWRRERLSMTSGTPVQWLRDLPDARVVEVICKCPPGLAVRRFQSRQRHPNHFDAQKGTAELVIEFERLTAEGPLAIGPMVPVDTTRQVDADAVAATVTTALRTP
jgi:thymidylate kinase